VEYIIIGINIVILILLIILIVKNKSNEGVVEKIGKLETDIVKEIGDFKTDFSRDIRDDFENANEKIDKRLRLISYKVNERLDENFEITEKYGFTIDLNKKIYEMQHTFDNDTIADCVLFAPEPLGTIAIDSKFPLENYQAMVNKKNSIDMRTNAEKLFKADVKRHVDAISSKYIIPGVTSDQAILFLPAEAIFAEINAYHTELLEYAYKKKVWITSPTTLISTLTTIQIIMKNMERDKYAKVIHKELQLLDNEFGRYKERWDKLYRSIETVSKDVKDIHTTTDKITKRFNSINQVEMGAISHEEDTIDY